MKTISELNVRWWYRLIKVIYFSILFVSVVISLGGIWGQSQPTFDVLKSYILCNNGTSLDNNMLASKGVFLYSDFIPSGSENQVRFLCLTDHEIVELARQRYPNAYTSVSDTQLAAAIRQKPDNFLQQVNIGTMNYQLMSIYTTRNWITVLGYLALCVIVIGLFFEGVRRVFYYIFLGKVRPPKR